MTTTMTSLLRRPLGGLPVRAIAVAGLAWNAFGITQFAGSVGATTQTLMMSGLTPEQAAVMTGYPGWMTAAFAIGVFGGFVGSALLLARHRLAAPVLALSLAAYVALWVGDAVHGVFAALGASQVAILTLVVAIAVALLIVAARSGTGAALRAGDTVR